MQIMANTTIWEKLASIPPMFVFGTSVVGLISWQSVFYIVSTIWVLLQIYFRLRKEWKKKQYYRQLDAEKASGARMAALDLTESDRAPLQ